MPAFEGRVYKFEDDINTDYIISSRRKRDTLDLNVLKKYLMEDIDPGFAARVRPGGILAAGNNFGGGSAMEVASLVIKAAGIRAVLAQSFARTFYRNAINGGLFAIETDTDRISSLDRLRITVIGDDIAIRNQTTGADTVVPMPGGIVLDIVKSGGLVDYLRRRSDF